MGTRPSDRANVAVQVFPSRKIDLIDTKIGDLNAGLWFKAVRGSLEKEKKESTMMITSRLYYLLLPPWCWGAVDSSFSHEYETVTSLELYTVSYERLVAVRVDPAR